MKLKISILTVLLTLFSVALISQTSQVNAGHSSHPIVTPITPVTSAFMISGKVTYKFMGRIHKMMQKIMPAQNITVQAKDKKNNKTFTATTDAQGNYMISVPSSNALFWDVKPTTKGQANFFTPPFKFVKPNKNVSNVDFQGLVLP